MNADLGPYFYLSRNYVTGTSSTSSDRTTSYGGENNVLYNAFASTDLVCFVPRNITYPIAECYVATDTSWQTIHPLLPPDYSSCQVQPSFGLGTSVLPLEVPASSMCFGVAVSLWHRAVAMTGTINDGRRFVTTFFAAENSSSEAALLCTSGCNANSTSDAAGSTGLASVDPSFGDAISLFSSVLVVGAPGAGNGRGAAHVYLAVGGPDPAMAVDGVDYGQHRRWRAVALLPDDAPSSVSAVTSFGAGLSLGPRLLAVSAPGDTAMASAVIVFAYSVGVGGNISLRVVCGATRTGRDTGSSFGLALAQTEAGPGRTAVAIGAPDEDRVYVLWVGDGGECSVGLAPCAHAPLTWKPSPHAAKVWPAGLPDPQEFGRRDSTDPE